MVGGLLDVPDNMYRTITRTPIQTQSLSNLNDAAMMNMAQMGNPQFNQAAIMEQAIAQQQMQQIATQKNLEVPKVNFYPLTMLTQEKPEGRTSNRHTNFSNPLNSILDPRRWLGSPYRYTKDSGTCVVDGCDCKQLIEYDNLYAE